MCGNPTKTTGTFYDSHTRDRALYKCHTVSSADSKRTNKENIDSLVRKYGWDSNVVRVRVRGEFPNQEDDVFIALSTIEQCGNRLFELPEDGQLPYIIFGVDVARFGDDETVIYRNSRGKLQIVATRRGQDLMRTVGDIVRQYKKAVKEFPDYRGRIYVNIDDTGLGGGGDRPLTGGQKGAKAEQAVRCSH